MVQYFLLQTSRDVRTFKLFCLIYCWWIVYPIVYGVSCIPGAAFLSSTVVSGEKGTHFIFVLLSSCFFSPRQQCHEFSLHIGWFVWSEQTWAKLALGSKYLDLRDFFLPDLPDHLNQHFAKAQYTQDMQSYLLRFGALGIFWGSNTKPPQVGLDV